MSKTQVAFEVGKQHLDFLLQFHRDAVLLGLRDVAGDHNRLQDRTDRLA